MKKFQEKLRIQNWILAIAVLILASFSVLAGLAEAELLPGPVPTAGDSHWHSMWRGFVSGASFAIFAFMIYGLVRNLCALRSEKRLKKLYIKENDERAIQVWTSARAASLQVFLLMGLVAAVVAGYFSVTVSLTILGCVFFAALVGLLFKVYYNKAM